MGLRLQMCFNKLVFDSPSVLTAPIAILELLGLHFDRPWHLKDIGQHPERGSPVDEEVLLLIVPVPFVFRSRRHRFCS